ncbi:hypothetical protein ACS0TY_001770 [Phlomoides rotata]
MLYNCLDVRHPLRLYRLHGISFISFAAGVMIATTDLAQHETSFKRSTSKHVPLTSSLPSLKTPKLELGDDLLTVQLLDQVCYLFVFGITE